MKKTLALFAAILLTFSCSENKADNKQEESKKENKITKFSGAEYRFSDSSVEPRYQRSYSIKVDGSKIIFKINSYETILIEKKYDLNEEQAKLLNKVIPNLTDIDKLTHSGEPGSTGEGLKVFSGKEVVAEAFWNQGENETTKEFTLAMKSLISDFDEQMKKTSIVEPVIFLSNSISKDLNLEEFNKLAEHYHFKIVLDDLSSENERKEINELRKKLMTLISGENWEEDFKAKSGQDLVSFNL